MNNITINCRIDGDIYVIDTKVKCKLTENKKYYLADGYKNPSEVYFIGYEIMPGIDNQINIMPKVLNLSNNKYEYYFSNHLFKSKRKAGDIYLKIKYSKGDEEK